MANADGAAEDGTGMRNREPNDREPTAPADASLPPQANPAARRPTAAAFRASQAQLQTLVEALPLALVTLGCDGCVQTWNPAAERLFGWTATEVLGKPLPIVPAAQQAEFQALFAAELGGAPQEGVEIQRCRKDGTPLELSLWTVPLRTADGTVAGSLKFFADISRRKQAERDLATRTRHLETLREITEEVTRELDLGRLSALVVRRAADLLPDGAVGIFLWDETSQTLRRHAYHGPEDAVSGLPVRLGEGIIGTVAARRAGLRTNAYGAEPYALPEALAQTTITAAIAEPLVSHERLLGVLALSNHGTGRTFSAMDQDLLRLFAAPVAIAIENARWYEAAERRRQEAEILASLAQTITASLDLETVLHRVVENAYSLCAGDLAAVALLEDGALAFRTWAGPITPTYAALRILPGQGLAGKVLVEGRPVRTASYREDAAISPDFHAVAALEGAVAEIAVPIRAEAQVAGVLVVLRRRAQAFTDADEAILTRLADHAAIAIANARLYDAAQRELTDRREAERALQRRTTQLEAVRTVGMELTRELDLSRLLERVIREAASLIGAVAGSVWLWDPTEEHLEPRAFIGHDATWFAAVRLRLGEGVAGTVAQRRAGLIVEDVHQSPLNPLAFRDRGTPARVMCEPLLYQERMVGTIALDRHASDPPFTAQDQEMLRLFAVQAAIAIENARLYAATQRELAERARAEETLRAHQDRLETLLRGSLELAQIQPLEQLVGGIGEACSRLLHADGGDVRILEGNDLVKITGWGDSEAVGSLLRLPLGQGLSGVMAASRKPLIVDPLAEDERLPVETRASFRRLGHRAWFGVPVTIGDQLLGTLNMWTREAFSPEDIAIATAFAAQAAIAIANAQLFAEVQQRSDELQALFTVTNTVTRSLDVTAITQAALCTTLDVLRVDAGRLYIFDEPAGVLRLAAHHGLPPEALRDFETYTPHQGVIGRIFQAGEPCFFADTTTDAEYEGMARSRLGLQLGFRSAAGLPILVQGKPVGVIYLFGRAVRDFTPRDRALLSAIGAQVGVAIENARLYADQKRSYDDLQRAQDELVRTEKLRALGQMAAGIAHDLNNMLATIMGQAELLRLERGLPPTVQDGLQLLQTAASDGAQVVRRLQDFARQRAGAPLSPCDLPSLVAEALDLTRPRWREEPRRKGIVIEAAVDLAGLPPIQGNPAEIREALTNLIFNAVDAMPAGGTLRVQGRVVAAEPDGGVGLERAPAQPAVKWVELALSDTGVGMTEEVRRRAFDPFFTTKGLHGTGLGLSVVYGIMERHGGAIDLASVPGHGTVVRLRFRVATARKAPEMEAARPIVPHRRILVVDDDAAVRQTLAALLRAGGHEVLEADGGAAALTALETTPVDLVLTDLGMPEVTGWDVARAAKARRSDLPVVLLTGWGDQAEASPVAAVDRVLTKPVPRSTILAMLAELTGPPGA